MNIVKREAIIFLLFVFIYLVLIPIQSAQATQVDNDRKLRTQKVLLKLDKMRNDAEVRIRKSDEMIRGSQNLMSRAQAAGNAKAEEIARQALLNAQEAKKKSEWSKARAEEWIDKLSKGEADEKSLCDDIEDQLRRDTEGIRRYQKTVEMNNKELQEWAEKNKKAQTDAFFAGIKLFIGGAGLKLDERLEIAKEMANKTDKAIIDFQVKNAMYATPKLKISILKVAEKLHLANASYTKSSALAVTTNLIQDGQDLEEKYTLAKATCSSIKTLSEAGDKEIKDILHDQDLKNNLSEVFDIIAKKKLDTILEQVPVMKGLPSLALFLRDYGYDATAWIESRERILQNLEITDQQLKAVAANEKQIKRTVEKLKECREVIETSGY